MSVNKGNAKDLSGSNPNIQRPDLLDDAAISITQGALGVLGDQKISSIELNTSRTKPIAIAVLRLGLHLYSLKHFLVKISAIDFLMCAGLCPKHLCDKKRVLFLFL